MLRKERNETGTSQPKLDDPLKSLGVQDNEDVRVMLQGSAMLKVRSPRWQRKRMLRLMNDGVTVWCESNKTFSKAKLQQSCVSPGYTSSQMRNISKVLLRKSRHSAIISAMPPGLFRTRQTRPVNSNAKSISQRILIDDWLFLLGGGTGAAIAISPHSYQYASFDTSC